MTARRIVDPDVRLLASIAGAVRLDYSDEDLAWEGSPFAWIKGKASSQIGAIGAKLVAGFFAAKDFDVTRPGDSEADRVVNGLRTEIKFSTLWKAGVYKFQQLRDQRYDVVVCLGVSPFDAHCWVLPKATIMESRGSAEGLGFQHGGQRGRDTAWLTVDPSAPPRGLSRHGGTLGNGVRVLRVLSGE